MLYFIYGTNFKKKEITKREIEKSLLGKGIKYKELLRVPDIDKYNYELILTYLENNSLFGEKILVKIYNILDVASTREFIYKHLERLVESDNIFIVEESLAKVATYQKIKRDLEKLKVFNQVYDISETILKEDIDPFPLCNYLELRNKKQAWMEWKRIYNRWSDSEAMALHGAIWWKWKNMWSFSLDKNNRQGQFIYKLKSLNLKYNQLELESLGERIAFMAMKNNNGEIDLMREIEKLILEI